MSNASEAAKFARSLRKRGWTVTIGGSGHYRATHPTNGVTVTFSYSPSDYRWLQRAKMDIRRAERLTNQEEQQQ